MHLSLFPLALAFHPPSQLNLQQSHAGRILLGTRASTGETPSSVLRILYSVLRTPCLYENVSRIGAGRTHAPAPVGVSAAADESLDPLSHEAKKRRRGDEEKRRTGRLLVCRTRAPFQVLAGATQCEFW